MRLRRNRLIECNHRRAIPVKDKEGVTTIEYGTPSSFCGNVGRWRKAAGGTLRNPFAEHPEFTP
ncbi:MAG: hypothetical protein ACLSCO_12610 [Gallintestinimicrobium sp.]